MDHFYGPGTGPMWIDRANCGGTEESLVYCSYSRWSLDTRLSYYTHSYDVSIYCPPGAFPRPHFAKRPRRLLEHGHVSGRSRPVAFVYAVRGGVAMRKSAKHSFFFTALHGMQSRYSDGISVCPSVCQTRAL